VAEENERLKAQNSHYCERNVLLEEEVRWLKAQVFGRTNDKVSSDVSADQQLLFNEAEVLAAIEAADAAHAARKTKIAAHEREHSGGRKTIPKDFPRVIIPHDVPESEKYCTQCPDRPPLKYIGMEISEWYRYEQPKIQVEQHQLQNFPVEDPVISRVGDHPVSSLRTTEFRSRPEPQATMIADLGIGLQLERVFRACVYLFFDFVIRLSPKRNLTPKAAEVSRFMGQEQNANA
jgi:hypothetical protein